MGQWQQRINDLFCERPTQGGAKQLRYSWRLACLPCLWRRSQVPCKLTACSPSFSSPANSVIREALVALSQTGSRCNQCGSQQQGDQIWPVDQDHVFYPTAIETAGTTRRSNWSRRLEIKRTTNITDDQKETAYLFQQLSVALQRGNAVCFQSTFAAS